MLWVLIHEALCVNHEGCSYRLVEGSIPSRRKKICLFKKYFLNCYFMYNDLKTRAFVNKKIKQHITKKMVIEEVMDCYKNIAFSTFPYINNLFSSKQCIKYTNSGNCIGLSMYIKQNLKKKYNIISYLIPASVPSYIMREGYLELCHVALAIPIDSNNFFIIDPAFYFLEPIKVNISTKKTTLSVKSVEINEFSTINNVYSKLLKLDKKMVLNKYQTLPKNTYFCQCYHQKDKLDTWNYILREVVNPDKAISSFFIKIRKDPFFFSTNVKNAVCVKEVSIVTRDNNIKIQIGDSNIYDGDISIIPTNIKNYISDFLRKRNFDASILLL